MIDQQTFERGLELVLKETAFEGIGQRVVGKVRDSYLQGKLRTIVVTDRISAFDRVLCTIPFKGQVLNGIAAHWFEQTAAVAANHLVRVPDPNVSVVDECDVFPLEMIVRGYLTGSSPTSILTHYQRGAREYCGHALPDGMQRHQRLSAPLITPTTKAEAGAHDELTSADALIADGVVSAAEYRQLSDICLALFDVGTRVAAERGLILVDTKYELGRRADGTMVVVDEIHTPDSSRYWYRDGYFQALEAGTDPRALDKDFIRRHLIDCGYSGDGEPPTLSDEVRIGAARRYIELYEQLTGTEFVPNLEPPLDRIAKNLTKAC